MPRSKKSLKHPHMQVKNDTEDPFEVIVSSIHTLADGIKKINNSGLSRRAVLLLLHDATRVPKGNISAILDAAPLLAERYLQDADADEIIECATLRAPKEEIPF